MNNIHQNAEYAEKDDGKLFHFLAPNEAMPFFFHVESLETLDTLYPNIINVMHDHNFYTIYFFSHAKGMHVINFEEFKIEDNFVFFLNPSHVHLFRNMEYCNGYVVSFTKDFIDILSTSIKYLIEKIFFTSRLKATICELHHEGKRIINDDISRIYKAFNERKMMLGYKEYLASLLSQLLIDFQCYGNFKTQALTMNNPSDYKTYMIFADCIEHNYKNIHKVADYAKAINLSVSTLNKSVLKVAGRQPSSLINERIIAEAKRLLKFNAEMRIKEIVYKLGFNDVSNFVKFFKRNVGISPMKYRDAFGNSKPTAKIRI